MIIHGHRAAHSMFSRDSHHGMTMLVLAKLARLAGIDQLHTGTVVGKMDGSKEEVIEKPEEKVEETKEEPAKEVTEEPKKKGFFDRIKEKVVTKKINEEKFNDIFWDMEVALLENNVAVEVIEKIK